MPTILQINTFINSRSTGKIAEEIGELTLLEGWKSYIAFGRDEHFSRSDKIRIGSEWGVKFHGLQTRICDRHGLGSIYATKKLVCRIKEIKPDIIHLHNLHGYYLNYKILFTYLKKSGIPVVWTLHDCWSYTGHCAYYDYVECGKWKIGCDQCPQLRVYPKSFFDRSHFNWLNKKEAFNGLSNLTLVPVSSWLANEISQSFFHDIPCQVIPNGVNLDVFKILPSVKTKHGLDGKFVVVGVASVWEKRKGLDDFIQLASLLPTNIYIVLVGVSHAQKKRIPSNVLGISRIENVQELADIYSMADCFVNPTYEDNFPTTNLEALACGTPVITYRTGGSIEAVSSDTGIIVEKGNIQELLHAIKYIQQKEKKKFSLSCRKRAEKLYNKNDRYKEYLSLYKKLLKIT